LTATDEGFSLASSLLSDFERFATSEDGKQTFRNLGKTVGTTFVDALELGGRLLADLTKFLAENTGTVRTIARAVGLSFAQGLLDGVVAGIQNGQNSVAAAVLSLAADALAGLREQIVASIAASPGISEEFVRNRLLQGSPVADLRSAAEAARDPDDRVNASGLLNNLLENEFSFGGPSAPPTAGPGGQIARDQSVDVQVNAEVGTTDDVATVEDVETEVSQQSRQQERRVERLQRRGRGVGR